MYVVSDGLLWSGAWWERHRKFKEKVQQGKSAAQFNLWMWTTRQIFFEPFHSFFFFCLKDTFETLVTTVEHF